MTVTHTGNTEDEKLLPTSARLHQGLMSSPQKPTPPPASQSHHHHHHQLHRRGSSAGAHRGSDTALASTPVADQQPRSLTNPPTATSSTTTSTASMSVTPARGNSVNSLLPSKPPSARSGSFRRRPRLSSKTSPDHTANTTASSSPSAMSAQRQPQPPISFTLGGGDDEDDDSGDDNDNNGDAFDYSPSRSPIPPDGAPPNTTALRMHGTQSPSPRARVGSMGGRRRIPSTSGSSNVFLLSDSSAANGTGNGTRRDSSTDPHMRARARSARARSLSNATNARAQPNSSSRRSYDMGSDRNAATTAHANGSSNGNHVGANTKGAAADELSDGSLVFGFGTLLDRQSRDGGDDDYDDEIGLFSSSPVPGQTGTNDNSSSSNTDTLTTTNGINGNAANTNNNAEDDDDPIMKRLHTDDPDPTIAPVPKKPIDLHASLPDYELKKTLGEGAFAKVKQAVHRISGISVAIKIIFKDNITADYVRDNLHREGALMRQLHHPHIIKLYEIIETEDLYCLVMELATGGEVLDYIVAHGSLSEKEVRKYCRQMVQAIDHLHKADIVHRDLKTENLLLDHNLNLKLVDFGLSNSIRDKTTLETMCGSPAYTAPELLGGKQYGKPVDIWSIGVNMYAMLTGKLPFSSHNVTTLHAMILDQQYTIPDKISEECKDLLCKLLVAKPKDRISMDDLRNHPWLAQGDGPIAADPGPNGRKLNINNEIVDYMVTLGHDREEVLESIEGQCCNPPYACYHLLAVRLERTGHLKPRGSSASAGSRKGSGRLTRAMTEVNLSTLNTAAAPPSSSTSSSRHGRQQSTHGNGPNAANANASATAGAAGRFAGTGRRQSLSGLRPPRPKHSRTRGARSPVAPTRDDKTGSPVPATGTATTTVNGSSGNGSGVPQVITTAPPPAVGNSPMSRTSSNGTLSSGGASCTTTPQRSFHRSRSSTDTVSRRRHSMRKASTDQPPVLEEVDVEPADDVALVEEATRTHGRRRTLSSRMLSRNSLNLDDTLHANDTCTPARQHAAGADVPTRAVQQQQQQQQSQQGRANAGRRATLHATNRAAVLKSLRRTQDEGQQSASTATNGNIHGNGHMTATKTEEIDLTAAMSTTRRRSSVSRRSLRGSHASSTQGSTQGSAKDLLPDIHKGVHPSHSRPSSSTHTRVRSGSTRRRSGERQASTSSLAPPSSREPDPSNIQTIRYPLNRRMVSARSPLEIFEQLQRALRALDMPFWASSGTDMGVVCRSGGVRLEAEVVKIAGLSMHGVHMQRQRGDLETYAEICTRILDEMNL
ncbi:CAMK/CAMKL protein kinase [Salpingoeca rosetta]|uniref:non-specific serine/threonine protein kinase n=1 Tax=Salpingoeca rosetta (strain ATCC 50818 / BSB-021) TaxID=946362 RepID=F2UJ64_SALR5|nr:CAMK/CAMKL protein kinase [Salpingoeca rosetta]EGD77012.1 CAMK/CAMKL protein kinase [Salpingoeca rosetta]|eukprot:XP_004990852.1 CAMK/CAMKL protein kinase [Salpingoeca rosetta]